MPCGAWAGDKTKSARTFVVETREIRRPQKGGSTPSPREGGPHRLVLATPSSPPNLPHSPSSDSEETPGGDSCHTLNELMFHGSRIAFTFL